MNYKQYGQTEWSPKDCEARASIYSKDEKIYVEVVACNTEDCDTTVRKILGALNEDQNS